MPKRKTKSNFYSWKYDIYEYHCSVPYTHIHNPYEIASTMYGVTAMFSLFNIFVKLNTLYMMQNDETMKVFFPFTFMRRITLKRFAFRIELICKRFRLQWSVPMKCFASTMPTNIAICITFRNVPTNGGYHSRKSNIQTLHSSVHPAPPFPSLLFQSLSLNL